MRELLLKDLQKLERKYEEEALLSVTGGDTDTDEEFNTTISGLVDAQQRRNAFTLVLERVKLVEFTGADAENRADEDTPNALGFKESTIRHSFDDGYESISIEVRTGSNNRLDSIMIPIDTWNDSSEVDPVGKAVRYHDLALWKVSNTAFRLDGSQSNTTFLKAIYGHRYVPRLTTP